MNQIRCRDTEYLYKKKKSSTACGLEEESQNHIVKCDEEGRYEKIFDGTGTEKIRIKSGNILSFIIIISTGRFNINILGISNLTF